MFKINVIEALETAISLIIPSAVLGVIVYGAGLFDRLNRLQERITHLEAGMLASGYGYCTECHEAVEMDKGDGSCACSCKNIDGWDDDIPDSWKFSPQSLKYARWMVDTTPPPEPPLDDDEEP